MVIEQGELAALVGKPECGKSTLLKMLGGVILPKPGGFFIPAHLRVLHISTDNFFFPGSLFDNLTFGVATGDPDGHIGRVEVICKKLGFTPKVLAYVQEGPDGKQISWDEILSTTQKALCMLARALIANPELLVAHKPTLCFDETRTRKVLRVLKEFVRSKGVAQDTSTRHHRRPRTCVFTTSKLLGVELADKAFQVDDESGMCEIDKDTVVADMLQ
eukprot:gnl/TRDRNA2_/TRDRNA2_153391_c1_seq3.p1 gnl/TRDRNA2_/TRDRNA2_153391_c1~~gnl/TRDRNA2_/TRDRNA2_153391_c1_seq3.p1  ORF type:complete len:230 (-),score=37.03 gnl/TRDRNA2_/TRDRNA2_153391_c1_seq3:68-718(-)